MGTADARESTIATANAPYLQGSGTTLNSEQSTCVSTEATIS